MDGGCFLKRLPFLTDTEGKHSTEQKRNLENQEFRICFRVATKDIKPRFMLS